MGQMGLKLQHEIFVWQRILKSQQNMTVHGIGFSKGIELIEYIL